MSWKEAIEAYLLHKEVYIDLLKGILTRGLKHQLARQARISEQYLSYILNYDDHRLPSEEVIDRLVIHLPIDNYLREAIRHHMIEARRTKKDLHREIHYYIDFYQAAQLVQQLLDLHHQALFDRADIGAVRRHYLTTAFLGEQLLEVVSPITSPLEYAQTCLVLHDVYSAINKQDRALLLMLYAKKVLHLTGPESAPDTQEWYRLWFNTLYALSITYRNINVPQKAAGIFEEAQLWLPDSASAGKFWNSYFYLDHLQVFAQTPQRFEVSEADYFGLEAERTLGNFDSVTTNLVHLLIQKARLEAYRNYGEHRGTGRVRKVGLPLALHLLDELKHIPYGGAIHHAVVFASVLRFFQYINDRDAIETYLPQAWELTTTAGLWHQQQRLASHFSDFLEEAV